MTDQDRLIAEVESWIGTPYHHRAFVKGHGVDCGMLLIRAHVDAGLVDEFDPGHYTHDWHMHRSEEKYLGFVEAHLGRVDDTELPLAQRPRDWSAPSASVLVWRVGRTFSHGALVTQWPEIVHAYFPSGVVEKVSVLGTPMMDRPMRTYSRWVER